jgi:hypothetical protein
MKSVSVLKNTVMNKTKMSWGFIRDRRLRADGFIVRAQSAIRADGTPAAQARAQQIDILRYPPQRTPD